MGVAVHQVLPYDHDDRIRRKGADILQGHGTGQASARLPCTRLITHPVRASRAASTYNSACHAALVRDIVQGDQ